MCVPLFVRSLGAYRWCQPILHFIFWKFTFFKFYEVKINSRDPGSSREMVIWFPLSREWQNGFPVETLLVAIVPPERWVKMDRNDCHTAWGNFWTLISSQHHKKKKKKKKINVGIFSLWLSTAIYPLQVTTFLTLAGVAIDCRMHLSGLVLLPLHWMRGHYSIGDLNFDWPEIYDMFDNPAHTQPHCETMYEWKWQCCHVENLDYYLNWLTVFPWVHNKELLAKKRCMMVCGNWKSWRAET
jgi:hypothetical protein